MGTSTPVPAVPPDHSRTSASNIDLVVVVNGFPRLSETFVLAELLDLERRGLRLHVVALTNPEEAVEQVGTARLHATVEHLPAGAAGRAQLWAAHATLLGRGRGSYLKGLWRVLLSPDYMRKRLDQAAVLAARLVHLGAPALYVHFAHKPATVARFASLLSGIPYAMSAHAKDIWLTPPAELALKVRDAESVLTCTEEGRDYLERLARGRTQVRLAYHGVDIPPRVPARPQNGRPVVLTVGRLVEKKDHATLLRAAALMRDRGTPFVLRIAGDGLEWPRLQRLVHELSLSDRVVFLGPLTQEEVLDEYAAADVFALPCRKLPNGDRDGLPNVVLEAMAYGLPVVATTLAGVREAVIDGECGLLVDPGNAQDLAAALERVLVDPALRARLGDRGNARVRERFVRIECLPAVHETLTAAGLLAPVSPPRSAVRANGGVTA
jgi:glycosyltransferase involved in cell wall biosynthesis